MAKKPGLDAAYALKTPEDSRRRYAAWADTYEDGFARETGYLLPAHIARIFREESGLGPLMDLGAGTGLVADELYKTGTLEMDALDISAEMLAVAARKGRYRQTLEADLTQPLNIEDETYASVVSAGTFTHGHVGPDAVDEILRIAAKDALFVLAINAEHFEALGFARKFDEIQNRIRDFKLQEVPIYASNPDPSHADDTSMIGVFRKR
ncbi:class I SAM-dependent methyltransferase [Sulfitobacter sp. D35]|uniref:class I SAM-dependent DNA methyltransferase n=1 Tax=Sulfitobacter sp. D35 TaxID=3083252 RepID=UPI00296EA090|nr:class I SAM-dependent methyltransferase [Sulfitobacter sp. D35]MDW4498195.1 class I SAM-dependent methyltransferase [Sulfitobacter sp. D35]